MFQLVSHANAPPFDEVVLISPGTMSGSSRSFPALAVGIFASIRKLFAESEESRLRNYTARDFSTNIAGGGRCPECNGQGHVVIDLHVLPELTVVCPECGGRRFQKSYLEAKYRNQSIDDVLRMSVREAFPFFRTRPKIQRPLQRLKELGLGHIPLGQPLSTLSNGELQRLHLARALETSRQRRILFLLDHPTRGLHPQDITQVLEMFARLTNEGHTLLVADNSPQIAAAAARLLELTFQ